MPAMYTSSGSMQSTFSIIKSRWQDCFLQSLEVETKWCAFCPCCFCLSAQPLREYRRHLWSKPDACDPRLHSRKALGQWNRVEKRDWSTACHSAPYMFQIRFISYFTFKLHQNTWINSLNLMIEYSPTNVYNEHQHCTLLVSQIWFGIWQMHIGFFFVFHFSIHPFLEALAMVINIFPWLILLIISLLSRVGEANRLVLIQDILDDCKSDFYFIRYNYCHPNPTVCAPHLWKGCHSQIKFTVSSSDLLSYIKKKKDWNDTYPMF